MEQKRPENNFLQPSEVAQCAATVATGATSGAIFTPSPPVQPSIHPQAAAGKETVYVGFWLRLFAIFVDIFLVGLVYVGLEALLFGIEFDPHKQTEMGFVSASVELFSWVITFFYFFLFWVFAQRTPGKMLIGARIVDARTGGRPTAGKFFLRLIGYQFSAFFFLGYLWVIWDKRKQGWHDKFGDTVVVRWAKKKPVSTPQNAVPLPKR